MKPKKLPPKLLLGLLLVTACFSIFSAYSFFSKPVSSVSLELKGNVDIRTLNLSFRVGGRLKSLNVDEGSFVKKGDILGYLDDQPYQIQLQQAIANLEIQTAHLLLMQKGSRKEILEQVEERLKTAQAQFDNANIMFKRQLKLAKSGAARDSTLDDAKANFESSESALNIAKQTLLIAQKPHRIEELIQAENQVKQAQAALDQVQLQINDAQLIAYSDGIVMTRIIEPGSIINAGFPVLTISLTEPIFVRGYVNEPNLGLVASGSKVYIYTDSRAEPYVGTIGFVSPNAEFTPKNIETTDLRTSLVYRFRVVLENPDSKLRQGMPVTINFRQQ